MPQGDRIRGVETRESVGQIEVAGDPNTLNGGAGVVAAAGTLAINPITSFMYYNADGTPTGWEEFGTAGGIPTGETNTGANVGTSGGESFRDKTGVVLNFRRVRGLDPITGVTSGDHIDVGFDITTLSLNPSPLAADEILLRKASNDTYFRTTLLDVLDFAGAIKGAISLGTGTDIYVGVVSDILQFRSLTFETPGPIAWVVTANEIEFTFRIGSVTPGFPTGDDFLIYQSFTDSQHYNADIGEVAAAMPFVGNSLGTGVDVYKNKTGTTLHFRSLLVAASNTPLAYSELTSEILLDFDIENLTLATEVLVADKILVKDAVTNVHHYGTVSQLPFVLLTDAATGVTVGAGTDIYTGMVGSVLQFNSISFEIPGPIQWTIASGDIEFQFHITGATVGFPTVDDFIIYESFTDGDNYNADIGDLANALPFVGNSLGTGADVYKNKTGSTLHFRSLLVASSDTPLAYSELINEIQLDFDIETLTLATSIEVADNILIKDSVTNVHLYGTVSQLPFVLTSDAATGVSLGTGTDIYTGMVGSVLQFRTIAFETPGPIAWTIASNVIEFTFRIGSVTPGFPTGDDFLIYQSFTDSLHYNADIGEIAAAMPFVGLSLGSGAEVYKTKTGTTLHFRSLLATLPIAVSEGTNEITFSFTMTGVSAITLPVVGTDTLILQRGGAAPTVATVADLPFAGTSLGSGTDIYTGMVGTILQFRTISFEIPGPIQWTIISNDIEFRFNITSTTPGTPTANDFLIYQSFSDSLHYNAALDSIAAVLPFTGISLGTGADVYKQKSGTTLQFRSLIATLPIVNAENANDITFSFNLVGLGSTTVQGTDLVLINRSGTNYAIAASNFIQTGIINSGSNLGNGEGVYDSVLGSALLFKSLDEKSPASGLKISNTVSEVQFNLDIAGMESTASFGTDTYFAAERFSVQGTIKKISWQNIRKPLGAHWVRSTDFSLAHNANIAITWQTKARDTLGNAIGSNFTPPIAGVYQINVQVGMTGLTTEGISMQIILYRNDVDTARVRLPAVATTGISRLMLTHALEFNGSTDKFRININQTNGSSSAVTVKEAYLTVDLLGAL